jgi:hypothetical protein
LRAVQLLLGHREFESTVRYLGVEVEDAPQMAEQTEVQGIAGRRDSLDPLHLARHCKDP